MKKEQEQKYYEGTNIEVDNNAYYKNVNTGVIMPEREYVEMIKREAEELGISFDECFTEDDMFVLVDEDGNDYYTNEE
ncbi:peptide ABC transporter ATPase [Ligilactobacillus ruminis DPC 6832]|uniref:Peptide ABC transporter ATPase n=1 Tax=Ligilactobacillus ruminis DPC 6832 TaxID=1402208 RepID=A0A837DV59_9LACO|nr:hypothetical protein [Ligilactobacillus ruminis]KIC04704.1 peptide ABC transporter ATPase [Ligilactobacillus ruminis DPC 6832]